MHVDDALGLMAGDECRGERELVLGGSRQVQDRQVEVTDAQERGGF